MGSNLPLWVVNSLKQVFQTSQTRNHWEASSPYDIQRAAVKILKLLAWSEDIIRQAHGTKPPYHPLATWLGWELYYESC